MSSRVIFSIFPFCHFSTRSFIGAFRFTYSPCRSACIRYCAGQYPPALKKLIARRKNFAQLEDFNSANKNDEYNREYMARMNGEKQGGGNEQGYRDGSSASRKKKASDGDKTKKIRQRSKVWAEKQPWENTEKTGILYDMIKNNEVAQLEKILETDPDAVHVR